MSKVFFAPTASLSVRWKLRLVLMASTLIMVCLLIFFVYVFQRKHSIREAYEKVYLLRTETAKRVDGYFDNLERSIRSLSADRQIMESFSQLSESFLNIENDNYVTPGASGLEEINTLLGAYYSGEIMPVLEARSGKRAELSAFLPDDRKQRILQYLYLAGNEKPPGFKHTVNKANDGSSYTVLHSQYHPDFLAYALGSGVSDILMVDYRSGYVFYSLKKNLDFATNLFDGPYKNTSLAKAFKSVIGLPAGSVKFTDESISIQAMYKPEFYVSTPVYSGSQLLGAVIFTLNASVLDKLLSLDKGDLAVSGGLKSFIVGKDLLYRNNDPDFTANSQKYIRKLKKNGKDGESVAATQRLGTNALIQEVDPVAFLKAVKGMEKLCSYTSEVGESMLCSYGPLQTGDLNWTLVSEADKSAVLAPARRMSGMIAAIAILLAGILYFFAHAYSNFFSRRVTGLQGLLQSLSRGEPVSTVTDSHDDEIGKSLEAVNLLNNRIREASVFVSEMGKGNIDHDFSVLGSGDHFGNALINLKNSLIQNREEQLKRQQEDDIRNWMAGGIAMFNDILRQDNNDLVKLSLNITRSLIEYLKANQGGLFLIEEGEAEPYLNLIAAYAFDRQKFLKKRINIGEGLTGTCVQEKKTILLNRIPDNYIEITSGLGSARPGCLLIVPLKKEEEVLGVIEIASFTDFKPHEVELVEKVAESIASAMITVRLHLQTSQYLERFQQQAEEMKAQDEELRQNIEELQATHETMERLKHEEDEHNQQMLKKVELASVELQKEKALLDALLDNVPECIYFKDKESRFLRFSKSMLTLFGLERPDQLLGKSDFDFFSEEHSRPAFEDEQKIISTGKAIIDLEEREVLGDGRVNWVNTTKMPLRDSMGEIIGTFGISKNISRIKKLETEAMQKAEKLLENEENLQKNRKLLIDVLDKIPAKVFLKDENGVFVVVNSAVAAVYNKTVDQIIGTSDYDNHPDEDVDGWRKQEIEIMETGENTYMHSETLGGVTRHLKTIKMPFTIATTGKTGLLGIQFDVTDMKVLEEKLKEMRRKK